MNPGYEIIEMQQLWFNNRSFASIIVANYPYMGQVLTYGYTNKKYEANNTNIVAVFKIKWK